MDRMIAKFGGAEILRKAVSGMLPKNKLRDVRLSRLKGTLAHRDSEERRGQGKVAVGTRVGCLAEEGPDVGNNLSFCY